jgi:DNA gyrase subunit B
MQWNNGFSESIYTFANTINTTEGGTHEEGYRAALTALMNRFAREWGVLKEKDANLTGDDIREGLTAIISREAARAAVRGPDEDQARQHRGEDLRAEAGQRPARRVVREEPREGKEIARKAVAAASHGWLPARRGISRATARVCSAVGVCPAS